MATIYRCRVTGKPCPEKTGPGRKPEYVSEDARAFAFRMAQIATLLEKLAPEMDEKHVNKWKGEIWAMGNRLNARMNDLRREAKAASTPAPPAPADERDGL